MKIAVCFARQSVDCEDTVRRMTKAMRLNDEQACQTFKVAGGAMGCVTTSDARGAVPLMRRSASGNLLLIAGVPVDLEGPLDERLETVVKGDHASAVADLTALDGAFAALFWDASNERLVAVTDPTGMQPLYRFRSDGMLLLATELKAFPASNHVAVEMDPAGWGAFISLGFAMGPATQLAGVVRTDAASVLRYAPRRDRLETDVYWHWPSPRPKMTLEDVDTGHLLNLLQQELRAYASHSSRGTVLLSGGFDSRLLLALLRKTGMNPGALIVRHPGELGGADGQYARRVAKRLNGGDFVVAHPPKRFYTSPGYVKYLVMSEVATPSLRLFIAQLPQFLSPGMGAIWEGVAPGFVFAPPVPFAGGFDTYCRIRCQLEGSDRWRVASRVFARKDLYESFVAALREETGRYDDNEFGVAEFQVKNQMRRRLGVSPLVVCTNVVLPFTPGLSRALWEEVAGLPFHVRDHKRLYLRVFREHFPEALRVPICSGASLYSDRTFTPGLWARQTFDWLGRRCEYYSRRLGRMPGIGPVFRALGRATETNELVTGVIRSIDLDHSDLNADVVRAVQTSRPPHDWDVKIARSFLFYWQMWRCIMEGRLTTWNAETFMHEEMQRTQRDKA